ncbi:MAG: CoB--CoM heterodisulfide reductase subunit C [Methanobacterium sp. Maddingley MBC34]|nr:MAG: CoB--CoM heterodisulfide reductase subunit C [Methanobacterium sp. Maddingley MBC34]
MSFLDRLKNVFSGGEEPEKKDQAAKSDTEKPPVETETAVQETAEEKPKSETPVEAKPEETPVEENPVIEEKSSKEKESSKTANTEISEPAKESEPDTEIQEEVKPEMAEAEEPVKAKEPKKERSESMTLLQTDENLITRADVDEDFKQSIMDAGAESVAICFQCGTCTGACPSGRRTPYRIRGVVRRAVMGLKEDVISDDSIWMCTTCYECQERCPRGIKIVDIVKIIRNQAAAAGYMAPAHKMTGLFVTKTGHGVPINDATMALRKSVGLDELPPTTHQFPEALEEVQTIVKATGFDKLIGYNWETGELE